MEIERQRLLKEQQNDYKGKTLSLGNSTKCRCKTAMLHETVRNYPVDSSRENYLKATLWLAGALGCERYLDNENNRLLSSSLYP